ncbi:hypothetical protein [Bradyrhizobium australiense]|nr:hypothetical protein [Bradyrhizobium australiense]
MADLNETFNRSEYNERPQAAAKYLPQQITNRGKAVRITPQI